MQKMHQMIRWAEARRDLWLDCVRIYLGLGLLARGLLLMTNSSTGYVVDLLQRSGHSWLMTATLLHYVILAHFIGGAMLTLGFMTRIAAFVQIPILMGAVMIHRQEGLFSMGQSFELSSLVLFLLVLFLIAGAGRLSLDQFVFRKPQEEEEREHEAMAHL